MPDLRENALIVGAQLFGRKGYAATSTRELTGALGTTNGNFYHHFATKEELLFQICEEALARIITSVSSAIEGIDDPVAKLEALIRAHVAAMLADQDLHSTMLIELRSLSGEYLDTVRAHRDAYSDIVKGVIREGQNAGVLKKRVRANALTLVLLNMLNWTIFWWRPGGGLAVDTFADLVVETFLDGARA